MQPEIPVGLTFDDVLLVPSRSEVHPNNVDVATRITKTGIRLQLPIVSAAMDTVTEARLAIALAQEGGIGVIHKNMSLEQQANQVRLVKKFESGVIKDPITVSPTTTIREVLEITRQHDISGVPVVEGEQLVGIVTNRDTRFETRFDAPVSTIMTGKDKLVTVKEGTGRDEVLRLLHEHRIEKVLVVDAQFRLRGLITVKDIQKASDKPNACKDDQGRLRVGAAVGVGAGTDERVEALVNAGVDVVVVDTAHGHSEGVIQRVRWVKQHYPDLQVIGGNIATNAGGIRVLRYGLTRDQVVGLIEQLEIVPVFTAHPTEATRRTLLAKEQRIACILVGAALHFRTATAGIEAALRGFLDRQLEGVAPEVA